MSGAGHLLRLYPRAWRERYGEELEALLTDLSESEGVSWRMRADVARGGLRERLRACGLGPGVAPRERARSGALLVLWAWMLFVVAGVWVQKFSEHWQGATPASHRGLPSAAFHVLEAAAAFGGSLVLAGIALALPRAIAYVRAGGWPRVRPAVVRALALTGIAIGATVALVLWARGLSAPQRNGSDLAYGFAFVLCAVAVVSSLAAWTSVAVSLARAIRLPDRLLRIFAGLAGAIGVSMLVMTFATAIWWAALARWAPWVLHGQPPGSNASSFALSLLAPGVLMALASALAALGAGTALAAAPRLNRSDARG
jgi:hypothetical protein